MSTISGVSSSGDPWAAMKAQRSQMQAKMFAKVDTNSDGGVDTAELKTMLSDISQKTGVRIGGSDSEATFTKMDSNADGSLSTDELTKGMKELMPPPSTMDFAQSRSADGNGGPDGPGGPPPAGGPGGGGGAGKTESSSSTTYDPLDTNQDGTVSEMERLVGAIKDAVSASKSDSTDSSSESGSDNESSSATASKTSTHTDASTDSANGAIAKLAQMIYAQIAEGFAGNTGSTFSASA